MMNLKQGDNVSFLNEKRTGTVKKILNNRMVIVEIEDGLEIPVSVNELVKKQSDENYDSFNSDVTNNQIFQERINLFGIKNISEQEISLAFVPENAQNIPGGFIAIYLVNKTSQDILFFYSLKEKRDTICKDYNYIDEKSALLLDKIKITDIENWKEIQFQFLLFKPGLIVDKIPLICEVQLKPIKFYYEDNYKEHLYINKKCLVVPITEKEPPKPKIKIWVEEKWENVRIEKRLTPKIVGHIDYYNKKEPFPEKHIIEKGIAEVDLHIEELLDNYSGKESYELLKIQLDYFVKMLESARINKFRKIIFIHGVGNGKLKHEIINILKSTYSDIKYEDAPFNKYGIGATAIIF